MINQVHSGRWRLLIIMACFTVIFAVIVFSIFKGCRDLAIAEGEKNLSGFLVNHNAVRSYIEDTQKQQIYRLQDSGKLYREYFSPEIMSATYIARHINELENDRRQSAGLPTVSFKFASRNPRNPLNQADQQELELLDAFNRGSLQTYQSIVESGEETLLYYALPIDRNRESCLRCHGDPADAPPELVARYGDQAGFYEKLGDVRAFMAVRLPVSGLLSKAHQTASFLSGVVFILFCGAFWVVQRLFSKIEQQKKLAVQNSYYLNSVLQSSSDTAIIAMGRDFSFQYFNSAAEAMFAISAERAMASSLMDVSRSLGYRAYERIKKAMSIVQERGSFRFRVDYNGRLLEVQLSRIEDQAHREHKGYLFMGQDISWRVQEEREREEIKSRLQKAEKMESIGLLAGGVAHDLNNILAGIINYPELILRKLPADSPLRNSVTAIQQAGQRAAAVVADLLTVARGVSCKKEQYDLANLVREYLESPEFEILTRAHPEVTVIPFLESEPLFICCSAIHIKKCLMNLVGNACEAVAGEGRCDIRIGSVAFDSYRAEKFNLEAGDYCFVEIADTGSGIAESDLPHIFEPFYSSKKMGRSGTGLGLSVVWNTVKDHQGAVEVASNPEGTVFRLFFPKSRRAVISSEAVSAATRLEGHGQTVLVVDDDPQLLDIAEQMLIELNYRPYKVGSGEEAIQFVQERTVDLVLLDMMMPPGINGRETYESIIAINPGQKAVLASGFSESTDVKAILDQGCGGFIHKPYTMEQLGRIIKSTLDGDRPRGR